MKAELTDTQKFYLGNEIAKKYTGQDPAYGVDHQQTIKTRGVKMVKKTGDIVENANPKPNVTEIVIVAAMAIIIIAFVISLIW